MVQGLDATLAAIERFVREQEHRVQGLDATLTAIERFVRVTWVKRADHTNNRPHGRGRAATSALISSFRLHGLLLRLAFSLPGSRRG
jgi:hypothetical protein